jgi:uncharacterized protein (TIGR03382 family)
METDTREVDLPCACPEGQYWHAATRGCISYPADDYPYDCGGGSGSYEGCPIDYIDEPAISCSATSAPLPGLSGLLVAAGLLLLRRRRG